MSSFSTARGDGALSKLEPAATYTDLLSGRLRLRVPQAARVEARGHSIMAAKASNQHETRVVLDAGKERLVMMALELFETESADLEAAVRKEGAELPKPPQVESQKLGELRAVAMIPTEHDLKREAILVLALYVVSADKTVQQLAFYVNPTGAADLKGVTALARRIAATVVAGPTKLGMSGGVQALSDGLSINLPEGFVATRQDGPDFTVHHLRKLAPFGSPPPRIGIYIGGHPSYQHRQVDDTPVEIKKSAGKILGTGVEWQTWVRGKAPDQVTMMEAITSLPSGHGLKMHIFLSSVNSAELLALQKVVESLSHKP